MNAAWRSAVLAAKSRALVAIGAGVVLLALFLEQAAR
jgi:hypothetical protein